MGAACSTHGRDENAFKDSVRKSEGKRPDGRLGIDRKIILE
jgi:hypothetical protein